MRIYVNGVSQGEWQEEDYPRLAEHHGLTVEAMLEASAAYVAGSKFKRGIEKRVDREVGPQRKIMGVVADGSLLALVSVCCLMATIDEDQVTVLRPMLAKILGPDAVDKMIGLAEKFENGDIVSPTQIKGLDTVLQDAENCAAIMSGIMLDAAKSGANRSKDDKKREGKRRQEKKLDDNKPA